MRKTPHFSIHLLSILAITVFGSAPAQANTMDIILPLHHKLTAIGEAVTAENAAESIKKCHAVAGEFKAVAGLTPPQMSYADAQMESCIAAVMHDGQLSDNTGNACSHFYAHTKTIAAVAEALAKTPDDADFTAEVILQLEHAGDKSKLMGCTDDYTVFAPNIAAAKEAARGGTNLDFANEILATTNAITSENAKDMVAKCNGFGEKLVEQKDLSDVEYNYYPALIQGCLATATEKGNFKDEDGADACSHIYSYAESLFAAIAVAKNRPGTFQDMVPDMQANLEKAVAHAAELKCPQDMSDVK